LIQRKQPGKNAVRVTTGKFSGLVSDFRHKAMKTHGMIMAGNSSNWFISGAPMIGGTPPKAALTLVKQKRPIYTEI
jgi:hypothetical protein